MGRLPDTFSETRQKITFRTPYVMFGEVVIGPLESGIQFGPNQFAHNEDRPFEIHRLLPRVYALDNDGVMLPVQPPAEELMALVQFKIDDFAKNQTFSKSATPIIDAVKGPTDLTWEWADPYYLIRTGELATQLDSAVYPYSDVDALLIRLAFEGFLCTLAPASERR